MPSIAQGFTASQTQGLSGSSVVGNDSITISSGMFQGILPSIPNLQLGYNYTFGPKFRAGTASVDYLLPFKLGGGSTVYGEAHGEFQSLAIDQPGSPNNSTELCFGGGYRKMFGNHTMIGLHGFYDKTRLSENWYSSGSAGVEMAAMLPGHDAIDLAFNWYGQAFDSSFLSGNVGYNPATGQVSFGNSNFDFQAGYSHELYDGGPDLRLSVTGYKFDTGSCAYGFYGGAELKSRDGVFVLKYDVGHDNTSQTYQSVAAFINTGFQMENLIAGKSPFVMPKPVFKSPRNMTTLTEAKPNRNWRRNTQAAIIARLSTNPPSSCMGNCPTITFVNQTGESITLYTVFQGNTPGGHQLPLPNWKLVTGQTKQYMTLGVGATYVENFSGQPTTSYMPITIYATNNQTTCKLTQGEINMCAGGPNNYTDTYDISLVNGFNHTMEIKPDPGSGGTAIMVCCPDCNNVTPGVYPWGCDICTCQSPNGGSPCPTTPPCCKQGPDQYHPTVPCQYQVPTIPTANWTVYIGGTPPDATNQPWCPLTSGQIANCPSGTCPTSCPVNPCPSSATGQSGTSQ